MSRPIEIRNHHAEQVGEVIFDDDPLNPNVARTATGFNLSMPAKISVVLIRKNEPIPLITNLNVRLFSKDASGAAMEIGQAERDAWYQGGSQSQERKRVVCVGSAIGVIRVATRSLGLPS